MPILEILYSDTFTAEMNCLRCECFAGQYPSGESKDEFDDRSTHVLIRLEDRLSGYGRLTPGPRSVFESLSRGKAQIPMGSEVVDFGRVAVAPAVRGQDLMQLILVEGLLAAADRGFVTVVGAMKPERRFRPFIYDLGFQDAGPETDIWVGVEHQINQFVSVATAGRRPEWSARKGAVIGRLRDKGYDVVDRGCPPDLPE